MLSPLVTFRPSDDGTVKNTNSLAKGGAPCQKAVNDFRLATRRRFLSRAYVAYFDAIDLRRLD